jgi:hypothetical protein
VGQGANLQIVGFVIGGATSETVLIRASGPAFVPFGVAAVLPDPQLQLGSSKGMIASSTGWGGDAQIAAASAAVGAFLWRTSSTRAPAIHRDHYAVFEQRIGKLRGSKLAALNS